MPFNVARIAAKLEIKEIKEMSGKLKTVRKIREKSGNFATFS